MAPKRKNLILKNYFCVCITVVESRNLPDPNLNSMVIVQFGEELRRTGVVRGTDKPYFNEYFVFDLESTLAEILDTTITVSMVQPRRRLRLRKLIGCVSMDLATVWSQPGRRLNNWLSMALPSDPIGQENGQVKCDIRVEAAEDLLVSPQPIVREIKDVLGKYQTRYMVSVYRCVGMCKSELNIAASKTSKVTLRASFAGKTGSTTSRPLRDIIDWNEQITFIEHYPPLFHKMAIELFVEKAPQFKKVFNLSEMYFDVVSLLSFGPSYVHVYVNECTFRASILLSINCELISIFKHTERMHGVAMQPILPLMQSQFGNPETFLCYCVIFDAVFLGYTDGAAVKFSMSIGRVGKEGTGKDDFNHTLTKPYRTSLGDVSNVALKKDKPCLIIRSDWPDTHSRLTNSNMILNLINIFSEKVTFAENLIIRGIHQAAVGTLISAIDLLKNECTKLTKLFSKGITDLDNKRTKFVIKQLECIAGSKIPKDEITLLNTAKEWLIVLDSMFQDIQETLPYIILELESNKGTFGVCKLHPRDFYYSKETLKKGKYCGKIIPIQIVKPKNNELIIARVNIWLWMGLWDQVPECINLLPPGHQDLSKAVTLPVVLSYETDEKYFVVCHIFQGVIAGSANQCHSLVNIYLAEKTQRTRIVRDSLTPIWRSTLVFENVKLNPSPSYLRDNPPQLTTELWNYASDPPELLGSATVTSTVRLEPHDTKHEPILQWIPIGQDSQILAAFEIFQVTNGRKSFDLSNKQHPEDSILSTLIKSSVEIPTNTFRLELVFWGIRWDNLSCTRGRSPQIFFECGTTTIHSDVVGNTNNNTNFKHDMKIVQLELPQTKLLSLPIVVRIKNTSGYIGSEIDKNVYRYVTELPKQDQWEKLTTCRKSAILRAQKRYSPIRVSMPDLIPLVESHSRRHSSFFGFEKNITNKLISVWKDIRKALAMFSILYHKIRSKSSSDSLGEDDEEIDWWSKYFKGDMKKYAYELEAVGDFGGFSDVLKTFNIKKSMTGDLKVVAKVKLLLCMYSWSSKEDTVNFQGLSPNRGVLQQSELSESVRLLVRVYCVKAFNLHPADISGKADPYIEIATQSNRVSDKNNYITKELNPVFGKCYEITAIFPTDFLLTVRVMDWDRFGGHDLIGETCIDLENRYYSKHRPSCGLASKYSETGVDSWRDVEKPTEILEKLCNSYNLPLPQYYDKSVLVASKEFNIEQKSSKNLQETREILALKALHNWKDVPLIGRCLVPEHIETRTLFHKSKPGVPQGKLEVWVDMFDLSLGVPPPPVDISRREPQQYELRIIIWNTAKVPLVDTSYFINKKHTDIFVKGWLWDAENAQSTDVHYASINGDGYFNWRFIFPFSYLSQEKRIVVTKTSLFDMGKSQEEVPAILHLQVWDSDRIGADEFIGSMEMELCSMPSGAKTMKACKIHETDASKRLNLFKVKRVRGWWPFIPAKSENKKHGAGLLEAEFHLLTKDEAVNNPAGLGRAEPQSLPVPDRPDVRFAFWMAPIRLLFQLTCKAHKGKLLLGVAVCAVALFIIIGVYSVPLFIIKKIIDSL